MDLKEIAVNIKKDDNGIYFSKDNSDISYPQEGNDDCMQLEEESFWFKHRNNVIAESVVKHSPEQIFFDIGGGNGFVSKRLQDEGIKVVMVEPGKSGAINGNKRGIENVICSSLENAGFEKESLDSVGLFDVVEHIENDFDFLSNVNKYLKNDGYIYITVPAFKFLWSREDDEAGHIRRYSIKSMNKLLEQTGLSVVYSTYIFSFLPLPIFLFRAIPSKLGFNRNSGDIEKHKKEHKLQKGFFSRLMDKILHWEIKRIRNLKKIMTGGSVFIIAKR